MSSKISSHFLYPGMLLPPPQKHGGTVVALVSPKSGTWKTALSTFFTRGVAHNKGGQSLLYIDTSFIFPVNRYVDIEYKDCCEGYHELNDLLAKFHDEKSSRNFRKEVDWKEYVVHLPGFDVLASKSEKQFYGPNNSYIHDYFYVPDYFWEELTYVIDRARKDYDLIILDTRSGSSLDWISVLTTVNYAIVPYDLSSGWPLEPLTILNVFDLVIELKLLGYPIEIGGIVPVAPHPSDDNHFCDETLAALNEKLNPLILPVFTCDESAAKFIKRMQTSEAFYQHEELIKYIISLVGKKPRCFGLTRRHQLIFIWDSIQKVLIEAKATPSYRELAEGLTNEFEKKWKRPLTTATLYRALKSLTQLGNQPEVVFIDDFVKRIKAHFPHNLKVDPVLPKR